MKSRSELTTFFLDDQIGMFLRLLHPINHRSTAGIVSPISTDNDSIKSFNRLIRIQTSLATQIYEKLQNTSTVIPDIQNDIGSYRIFFSTLMTAYQTVIRSGVYVIGYERELPALPDDLNLTPDEQSLPDFDIDWTYVDAAIFADQNLASLGHSMAPHPERSLVLPNPGLRDAELVSSGFSSASAVASLHFSGADAQVVSSTANPSSTIAKAKQTSSLFSHTPTNTDQDGSVKPKQKRREKRTIDPDLPEDEKTKIRKEHHKEDAQRFRDKKMAERAELQVTVDALCDENKTLQSTYSQLQTKLNPLRRQRGLLEQPLICESLAEDVETESTKKRETPLHTPAFFKGQLVASKSKARSSAATSQKEANPDAGHSTIKEAKEITRKEANKDFARRSREKFKREGDILTSKSRDMTTKNHQLRTLINLLERELADLETESHLARTM